MQGDEMKALRKAAGMSQAELGAAIGMSQKFIGMMERGDAAIEKRTELAVRYVVQDDPGRFAKTVAELVRQVRPEDIPEIRALLAYRIEQDAD